MSRYHYKHLQSCTGWQGAIMPAELCAGLKLESTERTLRAVVWRWAWSGQGTAAEALPRVFTHRGVTGGQVEAGASERRKHGILTHNCHGLGISPAIITWRGQWSLAGAELETAWSRLVSVTLPHSIPAIEVTQFTEALTPSDLTCPATGK